MCVKELVLPTWIASCVFIDIVEVMLKYKISVGNEGKPL